MEQTYEITEDDEKTAKAQLTPEQVLQSTARDYVAKIQDYLQLAGVTPAQIEETIDLFAREAVRIYELNNSQNPWLRVSETIKQVLPSLSGGDHLLVQELTSFMPDFESEWIEKYKSSASQRPGESFVEIMKYIHTYNLHPFPMHRSESGELSALFEIASQKLRFVVDKTVDQRSLEGMKLLSPSEQAIKVIFEKFGVQLTQPVESLKYEDRFVTNIPGVGLRFDPRNSRLFIDLDMVAMKKVIDSVTETH